MLTDYLKSKSPTLMEASLILRVNEEYWDARLVSEAIQYFRSDRVAARISSVSSVSELQRHGLSQGENY